MRSSEKFVSLKQNGAITPSRSQRRKKRKLQGRTRTPSQPKPESPLAETNHVNSPVYLRLEKLNLLPRKSATLTYEAQAPLPTLTNLGSRLRPSIGISSNRASPLPPRIKKMTSMLVRVTRAPRRLALTILRSRSRASRRGVIRVRGRIIRRKGRRFKTSALRKSPFRFRLRSLKARTLSKKLSSTNLTVARRLKSLTKLAKYTRQSRPASISFGFAFKSCESSFLKINNARRAQSPSVSWLKPLLYLRLSTLVCTLGESRSLTLNTSSPLTNKHPFAQLTPCDFAPSDTPTTLYEM